MKFFKISLFLAASFLVIYFLMNLNSNSIYISSEIKDYSFDLPNNNITYPVNLNTNSKTTAFLDSLYVLSKKNKTDKKRIISGQLIGTANTNLSKDYNINITSLQKETGQTPGIFGVDYGWEKMDLEKISIVNKLLIDHSNNGGIVTINFSLNNPWTREGLNSIGTGEYEFQDLFKDGTIPNTNLKNDLEIIAKGIKELEDNNAVVLIRPFQEMNGDWFWWSWGKNERLSQKEFKEMWVYVFDYFTYERKINNLLWVYSGQYESEVYENNIIPIDYYYPGNEYVDIVGLSFYEDDMNFEKSYNELLKIGKPVALTEFGPSNKRAVFSKNKFDNLELLEALGDRYNKLVYFFYWSGWDSLGFRTKKAIIEHKNASLLMNDDLVITREDLK